MTLLNYSTYSGDYPSLTIARNPQNFAAGIDLTGMSVARSDLSTGYWPACLVSKRHYIAANHVTGANFSAGLLLTAPRCVQRRSAIPTSRAPICMSGTSTKTCLPASSGSKSVASQLRSYLPSSGIVIGCRA